MNTQGKYYLEAHGTLGKGFKLLASSIAPPPPSTRLEIGLAAAQAIQQSIKPANQPEPRISKGYCSYRNLKDQFLSPPHNQGSLGWCASSVVGDLIGAKIHKAVSFLNLGREFYQSEITDMPSYLGQASYSKVGGVSDFQELTQRALDVGVCEEKDIADRGDISKALISLNQVNEALSSSLNSPAQLCRDLKIVRQFFPHLTLPQLLSAKRAPSDSGGKGDAEFFDNLAKISCPSPIRLNGLVPNYGSVSRVPFFNNFSKVMSDVDAQIDKSNPVAILVSLGFNQFESVYANDTVPGGHAMVITGRGFNPRTHQCDYMIRNSWGEGCKDSEGQSMYDPELDCQDGYFWLP